MNVNRLTDLYRRYLSNECSEEELTQLKQFFDDPAYRDQLLVLMDNTWDDLPADPHTDLSAVRTEALYQEIIAAPRPLRANRKRWIPAAAASVLLVLSVTVGFYFYQRNQLSNLLSTPKVRVTQSEIMPAANTAVLTLADGSKIVLDEKNAGKVAEQAGTVIRKTGEGSLVYSANTAISAGRPVQMNTITIPRGGQYKLVLPDGSRVQLNSASELTFPASFTGNKREVSLTGEAYFEVAKNAALPFRVNVRNRQTVEVLGTHFNITAYADEPEIKTTLIEGSVRVQAGNKHRLLSPGEMAVQAESNNSLSVFNADTMEVLAWKNGLFVFNNENIRDIMKKIERWYDIDVSFQGNLAQINLVGNYSRNKTLSSLLKSMELTNKVQFFTDERRVRVIGK